MEIESLIEALWPFESLIRPSATFSRREKDTLGATTTSFVASVRGVL